MTAWHCHKAAPRRRSIASSSSLVAYILIGSTSCAEQLHRDPGRTTLPTTHPISISLDYDMGCPVVNSELREGHTGWFLLDTGNGATVFSPDEVHEATTEPVIEQGYIIDHGRVIQNRIARDCSVTLGGIQFDQFDAECMSYPSLWTDHYLRRPLAGGLGWHLFKGMLVTLDYAHFRLTIDRGELPPPNGTDILPLRVNEQDHLELPAALCGRPLWLTIDTCTFGSDLEIATKRLSGLSWKYPPQSQVQTSIGGSATRTVGHVDGNLKIGRYSITAPLVLAESGTEDTLEGPALRRFTITLDVSNRRVRLVPSEQTAPGVTTLAGDGWVEQEERVERPRRPHQITAVAAAIREGVTIKLEEGGTPVVTRPNGNRLLFTRRGVVVDLSGSYRYTLHSDGGLDEENGPGGSAARWYEREASAGMAPELVLLNPSADPFYRQRDRVTGTTTTTTDRLSVVERPDGSSHTVLSDGLTVDWPADGNVIVSWPGARP